MKMQYLGGGLGNQILQYIFARYVERRCPQQYVVLDDTYFFTDRVPHNGYELENIFGIKANLLSQLIGKDIWEKLVSLRQKEVFIPQVLLHAGIPFVVASQLQYTNFFHGITILQDEITPAIWNLPYSNVYYYDYWFDRYWFEQDREENLKELAFPKLEDKKNCEYAEQIQKGVSVGIHVRRGDFVDLGWAAPSADFKKSCKCVLDVYPNAQFFVFTNDLVWCQENARDLGFNLAENTVYVTGNSGKKSYIDMQLLSMCRGIIRPAQSSFSQVAAWLDQNLEIELKVGETFYE